MTVRSPKYGRLLSDFEKGATYEHPWDVTIDAGNGRLPGTISRIGTVASALPREFQKAFTPTERLQLIWIEFDKDVTPPPYFTKVTIS